MIAKPKPSKKRHKLTDACDISPAVRKAVGERDGYTCVICGEAGIPNCHYISRAQCGQGIEQNIVTACIKCHHDYDNGDKRKEYGEIIREYLQSHYPDWNESNLKYDKWREFDPAYRFDNSVR